MKNKKVLTMVFITLLIIVSMSIAFFSNPSDVALGTSSNSPTVQTQKTLETSKADNYQVATSMDYADDNAGNALLYIVIIILSMTTLFSVVISFYLYKWRKILLSSSDMVVPEKWAKYLQSLGKNWDSFASTIDGRLKRVELEAKENTARLFNMTDTYMELQSALDEKDKEIKRLKGGYDAEIFRRFISRFARIDQTIDDFILEDGEQDSLVLLKRLFEDAFDECGVSKYEPAKGEDFRKATGVSDNPKTVITDDPDKEFLISEILESGYQLTGIDPQVIIPSKVKIYKLG